ncbi:MAG: ComF family protein [Phycisphaerae bacterium]|jgi:ComF family protein|nr:ComF family protein [Phycisphaerae bacterium]
MSGALGAVWSSLAAGAEALGDLVLPRACAACESPDVSAGRLCESCNIRLLSLVSLSYCPRCGTTVGPHIPVGDDGCPGCPSTLPRFARVFRLGPYTNPLRSIIRELKYRRRDTMRRRLGDMLGHLVAGETGDDETAPQLVIPVAMHWRRRIVRGWDHARALGRAVAGELRLPLGNELVRLRNTPPQVHLPRSRRIANMRGAFAVRNAKSLVGASILLVDDVTTTGATANEAARVLLQAGVARVTLAVVAKGEPPTAYAQHAAGS